MLQLVFFFNDTATTEIYTLSLHDALPIFEVDQHVVADHRGDVEAGFAQHRPDRAQDGQVHARLEVFEGVGDARDRKSTRLNSSHANISYAVFCLKKKKQ